MRSLVYSNSLSSRLGSSLGLLPDLALFYYILAVDAAMTAEIFLRGLAGAKEGTPAG